MGLGMFTSVHFTYRFLSTIQEALEDEGSNEASIERICKASTAVEHTTQKQEQKTKGRSHSE